MWFAFWSTFLDTSGLIAFLRSYHGRRIVSYLVDLAVLFPVARLITNGQMQLGTYVVMVVVVLLYFGSLESSALQATLGKRLVGLVVTDISGRRLSFKRAVLRRAPGSLPLFVSYLPVPFTRLAHQQYLSAPRSSRDAVPDGILSHI